MDIYTYSEARQNLASLLDKAKKTGKVLIKRKDGTVFELKAVSTNNSPLDVKGVDLNLQKEEINSIIREIRKRK
jgi:antitoxin (DNA-binding transcriptional repressor) of toxin-antitoxin stability system